MIFVIAAFVFMFIGRHVGWTLSKLLYAAPLPVVAICALLWGGAVAAAIHGLIIWQQPGWILRSIFGYALGAYVAIPNFGLLNEAAVPDVIIRQHVMMKSLPWITYIALCIALHFLLPDMTVFTG